MRLDREYPMLIRLSLVAGFAAAQFAAACADSLPKPQAHVIATGVWMIPGGIPSNREPDGNTYIFDAPNGLIVMDTGRHKWHRQAILDFAKARGRPIAAVVIYREVSVRSDIGSLPLQRCWRLPPQRQKNCGPNISIWPPSKRIGASLRHSSVAGLGRLDFSRRFDPQRKKLKSRT
jgi:hypothetical protein